MSRFNKRRREHRVGVAGGTVTVMRYPAVGAADLLAAIALDSIDGQQEIVVYRLELIQFS